MHAQARLLDLASRIAQELHHSMTYMRALCAMLNAIPLRINMTLLFMRYKLTCTYLL